MKYEIKWSSKFKKDYKRMIKRGLDIALLNNLIEKLGNGEDLPPEYDDHALLGNYAGFRECHIKPDWLLVYFIQGNVLVLTLSRTGSHSDLF